MKLRRNIFVMIAAFSLASCSSNELEYADVEAHEKTEALQEKYVPLIVGSWYKESINDKQRFYEQLTFNADGTLTGMRKWQSRNLVTVDGEERYTDWEDVEQENGSFFGSWKLEWGRDINGEGRYTDWEDVEQENGSFFGSWKLEWGRDINGEGRNEIILYAKYDNLENNFLAYSHNALFNFADNNTLSFKGFVFNNDDKWSVYHRGEAVPGF